MSRFSSLTAVAIAAAVSLSVVVTSGCGLQLQPDEVILKRAQVVAMEASVTEVQALTSRVTTLEHSNEALTTRLKAVEGKAGKRRSTGPALKRGKGRIALTSASVIETASSKAQTRQLKQRIEGTDKGVVIAIWATWCKPCIDDEELKLMRLLRRRLEATGAGLVSLAVDGLDKVRAHEKAADFLYPVWQRDRGHYDILPKSYLSGGNVGLPIFLVVDRRGQLAWYRERQLDMHAVDEIVGKFRAM
ncbi:MAG: thiol-disulfide isomerase/thioredoxin [Myxococcota bacterium]|jgi:thiol-disulfide isomerase/thioredoxin